MATQTFQHYKIVTYSNGRVGVCDPRWPHDEPLYRTDTVEKARDFVTAYRDGRQWAVDAVENVI